MAVGREVVVAGRIMVRVKEGRCEMPQVERTQAEVRPPRKHTQARKDNRGGKDRYLVIRLEEVVVLRRQYHSTRMKKNVLMKRCDTDASPPE